MQAKSSVVCNESSRQGSAKQMEMKMMKMEEMTKDILSPLGLVACLHTVNAQ
jgi:hypothetical protein